MGHLERQLCLSTSSRRAVATVLLAVPQVLFAQEGNPQPSLRFAPFTFDGGAGATSEADSATLSVPMNRTTATSQPLVRIPIVRFRATEPSRRRAPPIVYISGGTGSGIAAARGARFPFFQALRQLGDVVTFDLRGAGRSVPRIACSSDAPPPLNRALEYEEVVGILRRNARVCADSLRAAGIDPAGFNLRETVDDIESIRRALGVEKIALVGISTGSEIGLEYARRYGLHLDRAVLAGIQGPDQTIDLPSEQEAVVREFSDRLGQGQATQLGSPLLSTIRTVIDTLAAKPAVVRVRLPQGGDSVTVALGKLDAQVLLSATLGDRSRMRLLPALFGAAASRNYTPLATFKLQASRGGITSAFEALQDCQTSVAPKRLAARARDAESSLLGWGTLDFPEHCDGWGVPTLDSSWRSPVTSPVGMLLISGTLDGRTSVANARAVLTGLQNGSHLIVRGASHGDDLFLSTPAILATIHSFFLGAAPRETVVDATP
jgi:pimeloyl-ACP methyl ester carboxylesterase